MLENNLKSYSSILYTTQIIPLTFHLKKEHMFKSLFYVLFTFSVFVDILFAPIFFFSTTFFRNSNPKLLIKEISSRDFCLKLYFYL